MASLTTDSSERSPFWICCYTSATGRQLKKSTKIRIKPLDGERRDDGRLKTESDKRTEAEDFCRGLELAENRARAGMLTEHAAKKLIGEVLERTTGTGLRSQKTGEWLDAWLAEKQEGRSPKTMDRYRQVIRDFKLSLGERVDMPLDAVGADEILAYRKKVIGINKRSGKTANNAVKIISAAFNTALRRHLIPLNPCTAIEPLEESTASRDTFTPEQLGKLIEHASGDWKRLIVFGYYTGVRLWDAANVRWSMVDLKAEVIRFKPSKTRRKKIEVVIPIHEQLKAALLESPGVGLAFIFPSLANRDTGGVNGLSAQFGKIMAAAGVEGTPVQHTKKGRNNKSLSFHSLRHSFNSALANAGVSQELRMKLTGHTKAATNTVYTHHDVEILRAAVAKVPSVG